MYMCIVTYMYIHVHSNLHVHMYMYMYMSLVYMHVHVYVCIGLWGLLGVFACVCPLRLLSISSLFSSISQYSVVLYAHDCSCVCIHVYVHP